MFHRNLKPPSPHDLLHLDGQTRRAFAKANVLLPLHASLLAELVFQRPSLFWVGRRREVPLELLLKILEALLNAPSRIAVPARHGTRRCPWAQVLHPEPDGPRRIRAMATVSRSFGTER